MIKIGPDEIGNAISNLVDNGIMGKLLVYVGWAMVALVILTVFVLIYFLTQYKYKITYPIILYDSDGNSAQILRYKKEFARRLKVNKIPKMRLLFRRMNIEPIGQEHIKPGNRINLLRINNDGTWKLMPSLMLIKPKLDESGKAILGANGEPEKSEPIGFEYLDPEENAWALLELKESAQANITEEAQKRIMTYTIIGILLVMVFGVVIMWLSLKYAGGVTNALEGIKPDISQLAKNLGGNAPN